MSKSFNSYKFVRERYIAMLGRHSPGEVLDVLLEARRGLALFHLSTEGIDRLIGPAPAGPLEAAGLPAVNDDGGTSV